MSVIELGVADRSWHLQFRLRDLTVLFQNYKTLGGCLQICTSLTLHHCMVNYIGASPELINKSPLFGGVIHPTCSAQGLYLYHESVGEFTWELFSSISVWICNDICAGAQLKGLFFSAYGAVPKFSWSNSHSQQCLIFNSDHKILCHSP